MSKTTKDATDSRTASTVPAFTPGPWVVQQHRGVNGASIVADNGRRVVSLPRKADRPYSQKEADAHLIASAPDLYAALVAYVEHYGDPLKVARAALAKARGQR